MCALFVSDTNMVHVPYARYHKTVTSSNPGKNRGSVILNQPEKMAENRISLANAGPRLNAGLEKNTAVVKTSEF